MTSKAKLVVVEDEEDILELLDYNLSREGYEVVPVTQGDDVLPAVKRTRPDLILLDIMLPGLDGLEVCRLLKHESQTRHIPIVMLTAKGEDADVVSGLELGADDYITKPFSPRVVIARVRAVLRRKKREQGATDENVLKVHNVTIDSGRHQVLVDDKPVDLTNTEFKLLRTLAKRPGWVFTRYQLVNEVHGEDTYVTDRAVDVQVVGLRKKLGKAGKIVETVRGVGYRMKE